MSTQGEFQFSQPSNDADILVQLMGRSDRILVKKLSNNDRDWAKFSNKHQDGVYIPHEHRDGEFFPDLAAKKRADPAAAEIRESFFATVWPQRDNEEKRSRLVHYTSKGQETHLTRLPKASFSSLLPASFLVIGKVRAGAEVHYECLTIDSSSDEAGLLAEIFDLDPDFLIAEFDPVALKQREHSLILDFAEQVISAWLDGRIERFAMDSASMPPTTELASMARTKFMEKHGIDKIDPFNIHNPGDALREISRSIEWDLFRSYQRRERSVDLVRIVLGDEPRKVDAVDVIRRLIDELPSIDALMLSASQQRKSRAGYSYEHHIEAMLIGGGIPYEKQVIIEAKKRPDFILPSLSFVDGNSENSHTGLILSAKTTLRERWKQVEREMGKRRLFLTTVDENVAGNAIEDMATLGVNLVIPESLLESKEAEYAGHANVLSFRQFCDDVVKPSLSMWAH